MRRGDNHWAFLLLSKPGILNSVKGAVCGVLLLLSLRRLSSILITINANQIQRTIYFNFYDGLEYFCVDISIVLRSV